MGARSNGSQMPGVYGVGARILGIVATAAGSGVAFVNRTGATLKVKRVTVCPEVAVTGANTDNFAWQVINKGAAAAGTTAITAKKTFASGTNAAALVEDVATLATTAADLLVAAGDVICLDKTENGTGMDMPACRVQIDFEYV